MTDKPKSTDDTLQLLRDSLDEDVLTDAMTDAEVEEELRAAGGDPAAMAERGHAAIEKLLEHRRLAWQDRARKKLAARRAALQTVTPKQPRTRQLLLAEINRTRTDPRLGATAAVAFRKRNPEEASVEELEEMLSEFEILRKLSEDGGA